MTASANSNEIILTGECFCGDVRYEVADAFAYALNCHCSNCRRATGSAFKPFIYARLDAKGYSSTVKQAKKLVEKERPEVWDILDEVIREHPVMLNRAPTLHRLGIQAFEPILIEGKAIQLHPLVCSAFNADFDGDQMAVHLPLSAEAQAEARVLMLSSNNILSPASGKPLAMPRLDMVTGLYFLTMLKGPQEIGGEGAYAPADDNGPERGVYSSYREAIMAYDLGVLGLQAPIKVRIDHLRPTPEIEAEQFPDGWTKGQAWMTETTLGRIMFNELLPFNFPYQEGAMVRKGGGAGKVLLGDIIQSMVEKYPMITVAQVLDKMKDAGFYWATRSGVTISMSDVLILPNKTEVLEQYEKEAEAIERKFWEKGALTEENRYDRLVELWQDATNKVGQAVEDLYPDDNPIPMIVKSGAAGNMRQIWTLAGMKGMVVNSRGEYITRPIKTSFREGLSVMEYFNNSHGSRKGLADTALRTADSGYLTRRLVDVAQDVIVREEDCGTRQGVRVPIGEESGDKVVLSELWETSASGRVLATDVKDDNGEVVAEAVREMDTDDVVDLLEDLDPPEREQILAALDAEDRVAVEQSLTYPEYSAGRLMQSEVVTAPQHWTVGETIDFLRREDWLPDQFYHVILVDPRRHPIGYVTLGRLLASSPATPLRDIIEDSFRTISARQDEGDVAYAFNKYHLISAPVPLKSKRVDSSRLAWSMALVSSCLSTSETTAKEGMGRLVWGIGRPF